MHIPGIRLAQPGRVFLIAPDPVFRAWVPSRVHCFQQFQTAQSERSTWPASRRVDQPAVFILLIRPLSNSLKCEKCLLARLPGMFRLPKSSYNRRVIITFMNLRICASLYKHPLPDCRATSACMSMRIGTKLG
ncbi:uncharacterized protein TNCV_4256681 [Trichonephila clavipes]|nr:uncharacterized protein TNCV_4256681 [Trichonephila clavipes]